MSGNDRRQLNRMQQQIEGYRSKRLPVQALAGDLEFLLSNVDDANEDWKRKLLSKVGILEDTYAIALDKKAGVFDDADCELLSLTVNAIENLVREALSRLPDEEDVH